MREEVDVLVDDIETELGQMVAGRAVAVEGFPKGEMARDVGAHVLPRGQGGHVVVVYYHTYYNRKFRAAIVRSKLARSQHKKRGLTGCRDTRALHKCA